MESLFFHGVPVIAVHIDRVPDGFHFVEERDVPYSTYLEFWRWGLSIKLWTDVLFQKKIDPHFEEVDLWATTREGWEHAYARARSEPEDLTALRTYTLGGFHVAVDNFVLFRMKFDGETV